MLRLSTLGATDLRQPDGTAVDAVLSGPKRFALLAYLALARPRGFHRRDVLLALLWPEMDQERGRATLRTTMYHLRRALGTGVLVSRGADEVGIARSALACDAVAFEELLDAGRTADALALYNGPLLPGFYVTGVPEWERWLDTERARLCTRAASAAWSLAEDAAGAARAEDANRWARRAFEIQQDDEGALRRLIAVLDRIGDRSGAIAAYESFARALRDDYDAEPSPETCTLIASVRQRATVAAPSADSTTAAVPPVVPQTPQPERAALVAARAVPPPRRRTRLAVAALFALLFVAGIAATAGVLRLTHDPRPLLAVGHFELIGVPDSVASLPQMLGIGLSRAPELRVLSEARIQSVLTQLEVGSERAARLQRAARAAGADEILEGVLARRTGGVWRLDLRRVDLRTSTTRVAYTDEDSDLFELVDRVTQRIARTLNATVPSGRFAGATTSIAAYRLYQEGLRAYYEAQPGTAQRFFRAALAEDSTFAMAALYAARTAGGPASAGFFDHAMRMAEHASERDRMFIRVHWLAYRSEPAQLAAAETLAVRYSAEPEAHQEYARALTAYGRFLDAVPHYRRVFELDSLGLRGISPRCLACEAYAGAINALYLADSMPAAERFARDWRLRQPASFNAWAAVAHTVRAQGRYDEALALYDSAAAYDREDAGRGPLSDLRLRMGEFDANDRVWRGRIESLDHNERIDAHVSGIYSLRFQGRIDEALALALRLRALNPFDDPSPLQYSWLHATVLFEQGRFRESALLFDSAAAVPSFISAARGARHTSFSLAHAATAYAATGDTARLRELEHIVRTEGARSNYGRDRLLHYYVRGLRLRALGRYDEAIDAFRSSLYSRVEGNARASHELARTLIERGHAAEAVPWLRSALAGPVGASATYVSRTETIELLARAYELNGQPDSAALHFRWVANAWRNADPPLHARRARALDRAAVHVR